MQVRNAAVSALMLLLACAGSASAQATVTQSDVQRLQDRIYDVSRDVSAVRNRDDAMARQLQTQLDDLRDETVYLKVKIRKEGNVRYSEYADLRDRIDQLDARATGTTAQYSPSPAPSTASSPQGTVRPQPGVGTTGAQTSGSAYEVPAGTEIDARLERGLNSGTAKVEDRFDATTMVDLQENGRTVVPAGSVLRGVITSVEPATRTNRTGKLTVSFDQVTINGRSYPLRGTVTQALQSEGIKGEAGRIGAGAGVGAIIGGILGGVKGALAGILIGGGGTVAATEGKDVDLPPGTVLRVRLDSPLNIPSSAR